MHHKTNSQSVLKMCKGILYERQMSRYHQSVNAYRYSQFCVFKKTGFGWLQTFSRTTASGNGECRCKTENMATWRLTSLKWNHSSYIVSRYHLSST